MLNFVYFVVLFGASAATDLSGCDSDGPKLIDATTQFTGEVTSPGFNEGEDYPDDIFCQYIITGPEGYGVKLTIDFVDIEPAGYCERDSVRMYEGRGGETDNIRLAVCCGNETIPPLISEKNVAIIEFQTNNMISGRGFRIKYQVSQMPRLCENGQIACRNRQCFKLEDKCNGKDDCGDGTDEEGCGFPPVVTECGIRTITGPDSAVRVVGGKAAYPGSWPWQCDLQVDNYYPNAHNCGCTLINSQWVLTAAHCVIPDVIAIYRIHLGNHHKFKKDTAEQIRYLEKIIIYTTEEPHLNSLAHDIALLKLNAPVSFTDQVRPACLPAQGHEVPVGTKCMATGWGLTRGTGSDDVLKETDMTVQKMEVCNSITRPFVPETMICVQNARGFNAVCLGDSGGPLSCEINGRWCVVGATSYVTDHNYVEGNCAFPGTASVFAKVSDKTNWINQQISMNSE